MPVHSIVCDQQRARLCVASNRCVEILYSSLSGTREEQADMLAGGLQEFLDFRQRRNELPPDDPDRTTDPSRPDLFWEGQFLVSRPVTITEAVWDEAQGIFRVGLQRSGEDF